MICRWQAALFSGSVIIVFNGAAFTQSQPTPMAVSPPTVAGQTPLYDPQQLPAQRGVVQQFTLTPRGDIDGLILTDGTEVKTPPHLSTQIAYAIKPGDAVTIHGLHAAALPLVQAVSITNDVTVRTVIDNGPYGPPRGSAALSTPSGMMEDKDACGWPCTVREATSMACCWTTVRFCTCHHGMPIASQTCCNQGRCSSRKEWKSSPRWARSWMQKRSVRPASN
jgi:hypothetical protein